MFDNDAPPLKPFGALPELPFEERLDIFEKICWEAMLTKPLETEMTRIYFCPESDWERLE
jgi:hypothetical protein